MNSWPVANAAGVQARRDVAVAEEGAGRADDCHAGDLASGRLIIFRNKTEPPNMLVSLV